MDLLNLAPEQRFALYNTILGDPGMEATVGSWEWNVDDNASIWSSVCSEILGLETGKRVTTDKFLFCVHPHDIARIRLQHDLMMKSGVFPPIECRIVRRSGEVRHVRLRGKALKDASGTVLRVIGTLADITPTADSAVSTELAIGPMTLDSAMQTIRLVEPVRGNGGFLIFTRVRIQLSLLQFEFLQLLVERQRREVDEPESVRGYIPSAELLTDLPWETAKPTNGNLKQVIRKTRSLLKGSGLRIESARGHGYRLLVA